MALLVLLARGHAQHRLVLCGQQKQPPHAKVMSHK
jgi:hypothetical protein